MNPHPPHLKSRPLLVRSVSPEAALLTLICLADLVTTLFWISRGEAREGNPFMARFLHQGAVPFIIAKLCMFVPAIIVAEWYRPRKPALITGVMRLVIAAYVLLYVRRAGPDVAARLAELLAGFAPH